ncbi:MAG: glycosyltransferase [Lachnospiraceae bacterium]|nr:glycosyltransferase [Lachnospiraceae bacterium]
MQENSSKTDMRKICFIICSNDAQQLEECLTYLSLLEIPDGYETDVLTVTDATSMCAGYNEAMRASDAKFKVYLHQDSFIVNRHFLYDMIEVFHRDPQIGMFGVIGAEHLSEDGVMWHKTRCGNFYRLGKDDESVIRLDEDGRYVEVIDGYFMVTQYDLTWREDILKGWDFYDVSQCLEFRRAGYRIYVPAQPENWVIHDCGNPGLQNYEAARRIVMAHYPEIRKHKESYRILFLHSDFVTLIQLAYSLDNMGHMVDIYGEDISLTENNPTQREKLEETLEEMNYDIAVTYNFSPTVSEACERACVKYFAYCFDSPLLQLYRGEAANPHTYIGVFDKKQYGRLQNTTSIAHLQYVPLGTDIEIFRNTVIEETDRQKYGSDISFVGNLYDDKGYDRYFDADAEKFKREADALLTVCAGRWDGKEILFGKASNELIEHLRSKENPKELEEFPVDRRYLEESMVLAKHLNEIERKMVINALADRFDMKIYMTSQNHTGLNPKVRFGGCVEYTREMPKVFYLSKINLNITSRSIESGIPQRVWDILAVSGFCLTNWQPEIEDFFEIGKDLDVFHTIDELIEKADYYLKHEKQRTQIRLNGFKKVKKYHTYQKRMESVLKNMMN